MKKSYVMTAVLVLGAALAAQAAEPVARLDEVVVTATRYQETMASVPAPVSVIAQEEIEKSAAQDVPELLRTQPGVQVVDITGNKRSYRVDLRGFGETASSNTLVLVDGRRVNQPDLSGVDWALIPLDRVKRVEIIRGGRGSVMYGDNAAGGVVNIITKAGEATSAQGTVAAGSYGFFKAGASGSQSTEKTAIAVSGSYSHTDGYRRNSQSEAKDAGLSFSHGVSRYLNLDLSTGYHKDSTGLPGRLKEGDFASGYSRKDSVFPNDFADTEDYYLKLRPEVVLGGENTLGVDLSYRNRRAFSFASGDWGNFKGDTEIDTIALSPQLAMRENLFGKKNSLVVGVDYQQAKEDIFNVSDFFGVVTQNTYALEKKNSGCFLHDELYLTEAWALSGGVRHDRAKFTFTPSAPGEATMEEDLFTGGMNYAISDNSHVYASYAKSFRYPVLDELFSFFTNTIDTTLRPQKSDDFEIGMQHAFADQLTATFNLFHLTTMNEIFYNPTSFANENLDGKTRRQGGEIALKKKIGQLALSCNYTYTDARIRGGQFAGNAIPGVPEHRAIIGGEFSFGNGVIAGLDARYLGKRSFESDFSGAAAKQDDFVILNARVLYDVERYQLFLKVNNLTDKKYAEFGGLNFLGEKGYYPSPEINAVAGINVKY